MKKTAIAFGNSLDEDNFELTQTLLDKNCLYRIGEEILEGPTQISNSYHQNMIEGRKKLDKLVWGKSKIEAINNSEFIVHFTDYLTHKGVSYTHQCKQHLKVNEDKKIFEIIHINDSKEQKRLDEYYKNVGLK